MDTNIYSHMNSGPYKSLQELILGAIDEGMQPLYRQQVPLMKTLGGGLFTIKWKAVNFNNVMLIQQNHLLMDLLCQFMSQSQSMENIVCKCWKGDYNAAKNIDFGGYNPSGLVQRSYCSYRPCVDYRLAVGDCQVFTDSFRHVCLEVYTNSDDPLPSESVTYSLSVPTMNLGSVVAAIVDSFQTHIRDIESLQSYENILENIAEVMEYWLNILFSLCPSYLANFAMGATLHFYSDDVADSKLFQYVLVGSLGLILAITWIVLTIYRTSSNMMKSYIPFSSATIAAGMFASSYFISMSQDIKAIGLQYLWAFWADGSPFGVKWIGKAYFVAAFLGSVALTRFLGLFSAGGASHEVLRYLLKAIAVTLLTQTSSSQEIAVIIMLTTIFYKDIQYMFWSSYLTVNSLTATPTSYTTGRRISMEEYEVEGNEYTKKALADLKEYLQKNSHETNKYMDKFRQADKMTEATILLRFVHHGYSGRPSVDDPAADDEKPRRTPIYIVLAMMFILGIAAAVYSTIPENGLPQSIEE